MKPSEAAYQVMSVAHVHQEQRMDSEHERKIEEISLLTAPNNGLIGGAVIAPVWQVRSEWVSARVRG